MAESNLIKPYMHGKMGKYSERISSDEKDFRFNYRRSDQSL